MSISCFDLKGWTGKAISTKTRFNVVIVRGRMLLDQFQQIRLMMLNCCKDESIWGMIRRVGVEEMYKYNAIVIDIGSNGRELKGAARVRILGNSIWCDITYNDSPCK